MDQQASSGPSRLPYEQQSLPQTAISPLHRLPPATDPRSLQTPAAVRRALVQLNEYSLQLEDQLSAAIESSHTSIAASKTKIASLAPQIDLLTEEAQVLQGRLSEAAETSDRISGAVRLLDEERRRIRIAGEWVRWCQDLKASLASLQSAVDQGQWETACKHAQKAMEVPDEVLESEFANKVVPSTEQPLAPAQTLQDLRQTLLDVFTHRFKKATQDKNEAEASRFFRMLPLVGWRDEGLAVYCEFARGIIRDKGQILIDALSRGAMTSGSSGPQYHHAQLLTALFEQLALLIDTHQPVVDRHYGSGNFTRGVMSGLQDECDRIGQRILDHWEEKTAAMRKLDEARAYNFSFLANLGSTGGTKTTPKQASTAKFGLPVRPATPASNGVTRPDTPSNADEAQAPDGREVDVLLGELATMSARWATYRRFLKGRLQGDAVQRASTAQNGDSGDGELKDYRRSSVDSSRRHSIASVRSTVLPSREDGEAGDTSDVTADTILSTSFLGQKLDSLLENVYCPMERWYLRSSLEKAHRIDTADLTARPITSSVLDDAFFLLRATLSRLLSTCHLASISTTLRSIRTIADEDYIQILVRRMEGTWRNVGGAMAGPDGPRKENATRELRTQFVLYLNVLSISATYAERILSDLSSPSHLSSLFSSSDEEAHVSTRLADLSLLPSRLRSAVSSEMDHLFTHLSKRRLRILLLESYRDVSYNLDEVDFQEAEDSDLFVRRFTKGFDLLMRSIKDLFTPENFEQYFGLCVENVVRPWERLLLSTGVDGMRFTELGTLRFDKDWRSIVKHLSSTYVSSSSARGGSEVRDKFARLQQIAYVLSLDEDDEEETQHLPGMGGSGKEEEVQTGQEIYEEGAKSGFSWRLSASEVRTVRGLRV